jgi:CBS domain-containing protein
MKNELRVADTVTPMKYRVYPDTPFQEVVDLIVRRGVHAVPVVGEDYQVLGIITTGDVLARILKDRRSAASSAEIETVAARDVMTRTVLCVSEDQAVTEAAQAMVQRDVEQLPVVRDGALIGFLTRDAVLRALRPDGATTEDTEATDGDS